MNILITGCAGFIGYHLSTKILKNKNSNITGIDNINNYYDIKIKKNRLKNLKQNKNFKFYKVDLLEFDKLNKIIKQNKINYIVHLAAQAGVNNFMKMFISYFSFRVVLVCYLKERILK